MTRIPITEVEFHPLSSADPNGRLFWWKGELYRAIRQGRGLFYSGLFRTGVVQRLLDRGLLVDTQLTDLQLDGYELVVHHRNVPFVSYPYEWCAEMLKDAALLDVDLQIELAGYDLTLQDAHPWNIVFEGSRAVFLDLGSIVSSGGNTCWMPYDEFCRFFVYPLQLMTHGHTRIARWLLHDFEMGILPSDLAVTVKRASPARAMKQALETTRSALRRHLPPPIRALARAGYARVKAGVSRISVCRTESALDFLRRVRREVEAIAIPCVETPWSSYYDAYPPFIPSDQWNQKHHSVHQVLSQLRPRSVLDIGSNQGWFSQLAAELGSDVVAVDTDDACIGQLYCSAKGRSLPILPLVMNLRNPSPGYGICNEEFAPATKRLSCELVLVLALVHHLIFKQRLTFEQITYALSAFSRRWLLVEFIPREDRYVSEWWSEDYSWYTVNNFEAALRREFSVVRVYPSDPNPRILFLCEKR